MSTHFCLRCTCGAVIAQCRCADPAKRVEVRPDGCPPCAARAAARRQAQAPTVATYEARPHMSPEHVLAPRARHPATLGLLTFFASSQQRLDRHAVASACCALAWRMVETLPDGPALTTGLRKLLEAKDAFVRAALP